MKRSVLAFVGCLAACASDPAAYEHRVGAGSDWQSGPVSPAILDIRVGEAADEYLPHAPVLRFAQYDIALPGSQEEYDRMAGFGVIVVSVFSQNHEELPPKYLAAAVGSDEVALNLVFGAFTPVTDPKVAHVFGKNRWDGVYEIPVDLLQRQAELHIDFAKNRDGFVIGRFGEGEEAFLKSIGLRVSAPSLSTAPEEARRNLIEREYPGFLPSGRAQGWHPTMRSSGRRLRRFVR